MPRQKEFDRHEVLYRAMEVFWEKGFESTSVQDLVDAMGINRFSIYSTFGDKHGLFLCALDLYCEVVLEDLVRNMESESGRLDSVRDFFQSLLETNIGERGWRGCFVVNSIIELGPVDPEVNRRLVAQLQRTESAIQGALGRAQGCGELPGHLDVGALTTSLISSLLGLGVLAKASLPREVIERHVEVGLAALAGAAA